MSDWDFACPDWRERLSEGRSLIPRLPIDKQVAEQAVGLFNNLRLPDVPDEPLLEEGAGEWFREIVATLFGSLINGERMVREVFLLTPKKSSKTTYAAALMIVALLMNNRPRAEFLLIGPTKMIADLAFNQASGMISTDPEGLLQQRMHVQEHFRQITYRPTKAQLLIKSFDSAVLTGVKPAGVLIDELHEISRDAAAPRIIGQIRGGLLPNPEAFLMMITTQADQPPSGAFRAELGTARAIRDGRLRGRMLPILYEFPEHIARPATVLGDDPPWYNSSLWWQVTPNRGKSITIARLEEDFATAKQKGREEIARWASQHLNIELGLALLSDRWAGADFWEEQADPGLTLERLLAECEVVTVGVDGGGLDDLMAIAVVGRHAATKEWHLWAKAWCHPIVLERRKSIVPELLDFVRSGDLTLVDRIGGDIEQIADLCKTIDDSGKLAGIGLDPVGIGAIIDALSARGISEDGGKITSVSQGYKMSGAIKTCERKLAEGTLRHAGQPVLRWAVGNARIEQRGNAILVTKQASGFAKIDPLMAAFDAVTLMADNPVPVRRPQYQMFFLGRPRSGERREWGRL